MLAIKVFISLASTRMLVERQDYEYISVLHYVLFLFELLSDGTRMKRDLSIQKWFAHEQIRASANLARKSVKDNDRNETFKDICFHSFVHNRWSKFVDALEFVLLRQFWDEFRNRTPGATDEMLPPQFGYTHPGSHIVLVPVYRKSLDRKDHIEAIQRIMVIAGFFSFTLLTLSITGRLPSSTLYLSRKKVVRQRSHRSSSTNALALLVGRLLPNHYSAVVTKEKSFDKDRIQRFL